jgi:hypothetical protein
MNSIQPYDIAETFPFPEFSANMTLLLPSKESILHQSQVIHQDQFYAKLQSEA